MSLPWRLLLAALAGLCCWLAFAPVAIGPCAVASVALLTAALWRTTVWRGLLIGLIGGGVMFGLLLDWMRIIGTDAWLALALFCAAWVALMGAGTALVTRLPGAPVWVACLWVLQESLRGSIPWGGFPWGRLAFSQADAPAGHLAVLLGLPGVTFIVALAGAGLTAGVIAAKTQHRRAAITWLSIGVLALLGPVLIPQGHTSGPTMPVAVVQGGTPQLGMGAMDVRRAVLDNHVQQTRALASAIAAGGATQPKVVIWPENSSDLDPLADLEAAALIDAAAQAIGVPILVGAVIDVPGNPQAAQNVGIWWDQGPGRVYAKRHPVPFGEYLPLRAQISSLIGRFDRIPRDFLPGDRPGLFTVDGIPFGDVICFEVAYDDVIHPIWSRDTQFLAVQTNNATYGGTAQPDQQLAISRMRAIEGARPVVVAATTGVSALIAPDGHVVTDLPQGEVGALVLEVPLGGGPTLANRMGDVPEIIADLAALGAVIWGSAVAVRARRSARMVHRVGS